MKRILSFVLTILLVSQAYQSLLPNQLAIVGPLSEIAFGCLAQ